MHQIKQASNYKDGVNLLSIYRKSLDRIGVIADPIAGVTPSLTPTGKVKTVQESSERKKVK